MKVTYILPVVTHVRYHKRVMAMEHHGVESKILAFERNYYEGKQWSNGYKSLGFIQHGHYLRRFGKLLKAVPIVRKTSQDSQVVYCFGLDMLLIAWVANCFLLKKPKLVYEVADIRDALLSNSIKGILLRWLERFLLKRIRLLVVTSQAYIDGYYQGIQHLCDLNYQIIENKLTSHELPDIITTTDYQKADDVIWIGYFGLIRCRQSWKVIKELVSQGQGRFRVYMRGILMGLDDLAKEIHQTEYVDFHGPYIAPDDLPKIYGQVDLVWVAHYHGKSNTQWARANRFYESCYFQRPMITQQGTQDGQVAEQWGLGQSIDLRHLQQAVASLIVINSEDVGAWQRNIQRVPEDVYTYTNEHEKLVGKLL